MTAIAAIKLTIADKLTIAELKPAPIEIENQEDKPPNTSVYDNNFNNSGFQSPKNKFSVLNWLLNCDKNGGAFRLSAILKATCCLVKNRAIETPVFPKPKISLLNSRLPINSRLPS
jgi:hypothetical protein